MTLLDYLSRCEYSSSSSLVLLLAAVDDMARELTVLHYTDIHGIYYFQLEAMDED